MKISRALLSLARELCGDDAVSRVFEPLIADWSREWRDARGTKQAAIVVAGGAAYARSMVSCFELGAMAQRRPALTCSTVLLMFTTLGAAMALQPVGYTWLGTGVRLRWVSPPPYVIYFVPNAIAGYAGFALLPGLFIAVQRGWRPRRLAVFAALVLASIFVLEGWVHPAAMRARSQLTAARMPQPGNWWLQDLRLYASTSQVTAAAVSSDPSVAAAAQAALKDKVWLLALAVSSALLGAALGARARARRWRLSLWRIGAFWVTGQFLYWTVSAWAWAIAMLLALPRGSSFWMPSMALTLLALMIALTAPQRATPSQVPS